MKNVRENMVIDEVKRKRKNYSSCSYKSFLSDTLIFETVRLLKEKNDGSLKSEIAFETRLI